MMYIIIYNNSIINYQIVEKIYKVFLETNKEFGYS